jgi:hypothetical protein
VTVAAFVGAMTHWQFALAAYTPSPSVTMPAKSVRGTLGAPHADVLGRTPDGETRAMKPSPCTETSDTKRRRNGSVVVVMFCAGRDVPESDASVVKAVHVGAGGGVVVGASAALVVGVWVALVVVLVAGCGVLLVVVGPTVVVAGVGVLVVAGADVVVRTEVGVLVVVAGLGVLVVVGRAVVVAGG